MPRLFSYGTLRDEPVQWAVFGRILQGQADALPRFEISWLESPDLSGEDGNPVYHVARFTGRPDNRIEGIVYELSERELAAADEYETDAYTRILVRLASGTEAWVYTEASRDR